MDLKTALAVAKTLKEVKKRKKKKTLRGRVSKLGKQTVKKGVKLGKKADKKMSSIFK